MITQQTARVTHLWTREGFREDEWIYADSEDALASNGRFILPLRALLEIDVNERGLAGARLGLHMQPGEPLEEAAGLLDDVSLVALAFPSFADGRSFSKAELLRSRYGFKGPLRATGQVLVDQLPHMLRVGFDEFEIEDPVLIKRLEAGRIDGLPLFYQPSALASAQAGTYSWRRLPAG